MKTSTANRKGRILFTMGGKGGTGKTTLVAALVENLKLEGISFALLDLDLENKSHGSLQHFFPEAQKVDITKRDGLDILVNYAMSEPITVADMGSGSGKVSHAWFHTMYPMVSDVIDFLAIGLVTTDSASVKSVLAWAAALGNQVSYLIVLNAGDQEDPDFSYWEKTAEAEEFRTKYTHRVIRMDSRLPKIQNALRNHGATLTAVIDGTVELPELTGRIAIARSQLYRTQLIEEFSKVREFILP